MIEHEIFKIEGFVSQSPSNMFRTNRDKRYGCSILEELKEELLNYRAIGKDPTRS